MIADIQYMIKIMTIFGKLNYTRDIFLYSTIIESEYDKSKSVLPFRNKLEKTRRVRYAMRIGTYESTLNS